MYLKSAFLQARRKRRGVPASVSPRLVRVVWGNPKIAALFFVVAPHFISGFYCYAAIVVRLNHVLHQTKMPVDSPVRFGTVHATVPDTTDGIGN